jgi:hypothetical protein
VTIVTSKPNLRKGKRKESNCHTDLEVYIWLDGGNHCLSCPAQSCGDGVLQLLVSHNFELLAGVKTIVETWIWRGQRSIWRKLVRTPDLTRCRHVTSKRQG